MAGTGQADRIARAQAGDRAAFDALYDALLPLAWRRVARAGVERATVERRVRRVLTHAFLRLAEHPDEPALAEHVCALADRAAAGRLREPAAARLPARARAGLPGIRVRGRRDRGREEGPASA